MNHAEPSRGSLHCSHVQRSWDSVQAHCFHACGALSWDKRHRKQKIEIACETLVDLEKFWNPSWWDTCMFPKQLHSPAKGFKECNQKTEKIWKVTKINQRNSLVYWQVPSENRSSLNLYLNLYSTSKKSDSPQCSFRILQPKIRYPLPFDTFEWMIFLLPRWGYGLLPWRLTSPWSW